MSSEFAGPFVGLRPFESADRTRFHGRAAEIATVRDLWISNRLLIVYGASGVGKTSLLKAGVLPEVMGSASPYLVETLPVGRVPQAAATLRPDPDGPNPYVFRLLSSWSPDQSVAELANLSLTGFLRGRSPLSDEDGHELPLLASIDQFEELFIDRGQTAEWREDFLEQLTVATKEVPRLRLLISIRYEYVGSLLPYEARISSPHRARFEVRPLSRESALEAVIGPIQHTQHLFAPDAAERIVDRLRTTTVTSSVGETTTLLSDTVEPLRLQASCSRIWNSIPAGNAHIDDVDLSMDEGIEEVLSDYCTAAVIAVAEELKIRESDLWDWIAGTFLTEHGSGTIAYEGVDRTGHLPNRAAGALESRQVLKSEKRLRFRWYELAHDRLIAVIEGQTRPRRRPRVDWVNDGAYGYLRQAHAALADGNLSLAEAYALEAMRRSPFQNSEVGNEALAFAARLQASQGLTERAIESYRRKIHAYIQAENPVAVGRLRAELGHHLLATGDSAGALDELSIAVRLLPGEVAVKVNLARALDNLDQGPGALAMLSAALTVAPDSVEALVERALLLAGRGSRRDAENDLRNAIRLDPTVAEREDVRTALAHLEGS